MTARAEQETTVTAGRDDEYVHIWTNDPTSVTILEKSSRVVKDSTDSEGVGGFYRIRRTDFHPLKGFKRRSKPMTPEQREAAAARLAAAREAQNNQEEN